MRNVNEGVSAIIFLIMGVGMAGLVLIFVSVMGGQVYSQTAGQITSISLDTTNETSGNITAVPYIYNATRTRIWPGSVTVYYTNNTNHFPALTENTNYTILNYETGQINITDVRIGDGINNVSVDYTTGDPLIEANITGGIRSTFQGLNTVGGYIPIIVLAVIIFLVLGLVMSLTPGGVPRGYGASAL